MNKKNFFRKFLSCLASVSLASGCGLNSVLAYAESTDTVDFTEDYENAIMYVETTTYSEYYDKYSGEIVPNKKLLFRLLTIKQLKMVSFQREATEMMMM